MPKKSLVHTMGSSLSAIADAEDEYDALCLLYKEKSTGDCYSDHAKILRKWRDDHRAPPKDCAEQEQQRIEFEAFAAQKAQEKADLDRDHFERRIQVAQHNPPISYEEMLLIIKSADRNWETDSLLTVRACSEIINLREQVRRMEVRLKMAEDRVSRSM